LEQAHARRASTPATHDRAVPSLSWGAALRHLFTIPEICLYAAAASVTHTLNPKPAGRKVVLTVF
jgi:hypothetical protein